MVLLYKSKNTSERHLLYMYMNVNVVISHSQTVVKTVQGYYGVDIFNYFFVF